MTAPFGEVRIVDDVPAAFADLVVEEAPESVALSGGGLARRCYAALAARDVDWRGVTVLLGDERRVPVDHDDSNEGMARRVLLDHVKPVTVHSMVGLGADCYDELVRALPPVELVHLGLGADGHTASLFAGSPALDADPGRLVVMNEDPSGRNPYARMTLTLSGIARARLALFTVSGAGKREAMQRIADGEDLPAARVRADRVVWLVDSAAAPR